jgi:hypothetical protein
MLPGERRSDRSGEPQRACWNAESAETLPVFPVFLAGIVKVCGLGSVCVKFRKIRFR